MAKKDEERQKRVQSKQKKKKLIIALVAVLAVAAVVGIIFLVKTKKKAKEPSCVLHEYKGLELSTFDATVTDEDIDIYLASALKSTPNYVPDEAKASDAVAKKDIVSIDFVGKIDGKEFEGGAAKDYILKIGSGSMINGFEDGIIGMKLGDTKDVETKFPDYYPNNPDLAKKIAVFSITVNYFGKETNEIDDAYIVRNTKYKTVEEYKEKYVKGYLAETKEMYAKRFLETQTVTKLIDNATFKNIDKEIDDYYNRLYNQFSATAAQSQMTLEQYVAYFENCTFDEFKENLRKQCDRGVKQNMIMEQIIKKEKLEVTDDVYKKYIDKVIDENNAGSEKGLQSMFSESEIDNMILMTYALDKVYEYATITETKE